MLEVRDVVMDFPGIRALDHISLSFAPSQVHGVVGENGAGKSTLMKILAGIQRPTSGEILLDGVAQDISLAMVHQELNLIPTLRVWENIVLGNEPGTGVINAAEGRRIATEALSRVGVSFDVDTFIEDLSVADQQMVEIAKSISTGAKWVIFDEPTAVLSVTESEALFALISDLVKSGQSILYISHRLAEIDLICDTVSVLRDGKLVAVLQRGEAGPEQVANLMVGRELSDVFPVKTRVEGSREWRIELFDQSLEIRKGEIVGLGGLVGSGRTELAEALIGLRQNPGLRLQHNGNTLNCRNPEDGLRAGIAYVSEDRKDSGLILNMTCRENLTLASLKDFSKSMGVISTAAEESIYLEEQKKFNIKAANSGVEIGSLSGGNQQKIAIAKWLLTAPKLLILDEPTRGVDVGAKKEIYDIIARLAAEGMACIVISSEMIELIGLCDRVAVMAEGKLVGELQGSEVTEQNIMRLAANLTHA